MVRQVLVIGEALVDVVSTPGQPGRVLPGGSPLNVALGLSRLELPARLHTHYGHDEYGDLLDAYLASNGVTISGGRGPLPTSVAEAVIGDDGRATYTFRVRWDPPPLAASEAAPSALHIGSIAAVLEPGATLARTAVARLRDRVTISFDPNIRPSLIGERGPARERIRSLVAAADIVKASDEDVTWLYPGTDVDRVAWDWLGLGPSLVVVTRGAAGALALTRAGALEVAAPIVRVADTIGAGDSFMAGLLAGLADRDLLDRDRLQAIDREATVAVLAFAARCAAVTVSRPGADLPHRRELTAGSAEVA